MGAKQWKCGASKQASHFSHMVHWAFNEAVSFLAQNGRQTVEPGVDQDDFWRNVKKIGLKQCGFLQADVDHFIKSIGQFVELISI
jgi:hypothetical protein